mmetsp:Transcript_138363/g.430199  ORF Transcript_138363/g.430199 Transcript_138363/m.430199 type:complete len:395 (+) Transcript_138363:85-1269(+)
MWNPFCRLTADSPTAGHHRAIQHASAEHLRALNFAFTVQPHPAHISNAKDAPRTKAGSRTELRGHLAPPAATLRGPQPQGRPLRQLRLGADLRRHSVPADCPVSGHERGQSLQHLGLGQELLRDAPERLLDALPRPRELVASIQPLRHLLLGLRQCLVDLVGPSAGGDRPGLLLDLPWALRDGAGQDLRMAGVAVRREGLAGPPSRQDLCLLGRAAARVGCQAAPPSRPVAAVQPDLLPDLRDVEVDEDDHGVQVVAPHPEDLVGKLLVVHASAAVRVHETEDDVQVLAPDVHALHRSLEVQLLVEATEKLRESQGTVLVVVQVPADGDEVGLGVLLLRHLAREQLLLRLLAALRSLVQHGRQNEVDHRQLNAAQHRDKEQDRRWVALHEGQSD